MYDPSKPYKKQILDLIKQTWNTPYVSVQEGTYSMIEKKFSHKEVDHTDGIGTKGYYHWLNRTFKKATLDALEMNLNDFALVRATPYKLQNHIILPQDDRKAILEIVEALVDECKKRGIAITGGETSIHDNMYGMDISMTVSGFVKDYKPNKFQVGDVLIGLPSNGLHSNGFTLVRKFFDDPYNPAFVEPTKDYLDTILSLDEQFDIHGMMHMTGGAYTKLKDLLDKADARIRKDHGLRPHTIFKDLYGQGISDEDMYKTFNCGIGFILSASPEDADKILYPIEGEVIGAVVPGKGKVNIESMFSNKEIIL